jgi:hypothetical protein
MPDTIPGELKAAAAGPDNKSLEGNTLGS